MMYLFAIFSGTRGDDFPVSTVDKARFFFFLMFPAKSYNGSLRYSASFERTLP